MSMSIGQLANHQPVTCPPDTSVKELVALMRGKQVGSVLVVQRVADGLHLCGIVTDRDIVVKVAAADIDLDAVVASDVATADVVVAHQNDSIGDAIRNMRKSAVKRLPVVNSRGCLIGIVSGDDLLVYLARELQELSAAFMHSGKDNPSIREAKSLEAN